MHFAAELRARVWGACSERVVHAAQCSGPIGVREKGRKEVLLCVQIAIDCVQLGLCARPIDCVRQTVCTSAAPTHSCTVRPRQRRLMMHTLTMTTNELSFFLASIWPKKWRQTHSEATRDCLWGRTALWRSCRGGQVADREPLSLSRPPPLVRRTFEPWPAGRPAS